MAAEAHIGAAHVRLGAARSAAALLLAAFAALAAGPAAAQTSDLVSKTAFRVCADPGNWPLSDDKGTGFENKLAELLASKMGLPLEYTWFPMATGFIRKTLRENRCDVVMGYVQGNEMVLNTNHYYTSTYVLVTPPDSPLKDAKSLGDPVFAGKRLGVVAGSPPANHMNRYGLLGDAKSYRLMVDRRYENPAEEMMRDLKAGAIDAAILWGPIGGPLVKRDHPEFVATPMLSESLPPKYDYRITMGVRQGEKEWQRKLNSLIRRNQKEIDAILAEAGVPLLNDMGTALLDGTQ